MTPPAKEVEGGGLRAHENRRDRKIGDRVLPPKSGCAWEGGAIGCWCGRGGAVQAVIERTVNPSLCEPRDALAPISDRPRQVRDPQKTLSKHLHTRATGESGLHETNAATVILGAFVWQRMLRRNQL